MRSDAEAAASGDRCAYRAGIVMVLWPARVRISLIETPAIANHEQKVCRLLCQVYPVIFASASVGSNHDRQRSESLL